jgi:membrane peptidoglycan carboxypeptidase
VRHELEDRFGPNLYTRPLRIVTTLDSAAQRAAEEELRRQLKLVESGEMGSFQGSRYSPDVGVSAGGTPYLQGAAVMMDAHDGDVLAWVGGRDFAQSQFDRVVQARRQPGSAFKPFVYAAALADGFVLSQPLLDEPLKVKLSNGQVWQPKNFSDRYEGEISMRDALVRSKNVPTVRLADAVGLKAVTQVAHRVGIEEPIAPVPSIALGTTAVSPLELTAAYTGFASLGQAVEPRLILRVEDEKGKVIWRSEPRRHSVLDPGVAFLITDVLAESVVSGTGNPVQQTGLKAPAAGKTGTTNDGADAWFVGYTPEIAAGVWIGFDKPRPILDKATGGGLAAPVWGRMLARVYQSRPAPKPWTAPADVIPHWIDPPTGLVIKEGCAPQHGFARPELFLKGKEPAAYCPGHEAPPANPFPTDRLLRQNQEAQQEAERLAQQRAAEQRAQAEREAKQKEQERLARVEQEKADQEEKREQARLAELAREEQRKKAEAEKLASARKAAETEKERAALKAREERIAREEAAASRREAEIAAREKEEQEKDRRAKEAAAREEARLQRLRDQHNDEDADMVVAARTRRTRDEDREDSAEEPKAAGQDLSGWWELTNTIASTNYAAYRGLRLTYRLQLEQDGDRLTGRGQKWAEEGAPVSAAGRSPISVTGRIEGNKVVLQFTERGAKRSTTGSFSWSLAPNGNALRGTFWSTAAATSGGSVARRLR